MITKIGVEKRANKGGAAPSTNLHIDARTAKRSIKYETKIDASDIATRCFVVILMAKRAPKIIANMRLSENSSDDFQMNPPDTNVKRARKLMIEYIPKFIFLYIVS